jgi:hypothetical protein
MRETHSHRACGVARQRKIWPPFTQTKTLQQKYYGSAVSIHVLGWVGRSHVGITITQQMLIATLKTNKYRDVREDVVT